MVNIKMDDPSRARISTRCGTPRRSTPGCGSGPSPRERGHYEPDVSELVRAKAYQQFGRHFPM